MKSFIEINNRKMEILQSGKDGIPILILTGMACSFEEWVEITQILSRNDRVIMYHRPGLGASEIGAERRTTAQSYEEIMSLLESLDVTEPVFRGSLGAVNKGPGRAFFRQQAGFC